jgi:hypothetical protein
MHSRMMLVCFLSLLLAAAGPAQTGNQDTSQGYREVLNSVTGASQIEATTATKESKLTLESSDAQLVKSFDWARRQAMAYVFDGDEVGPWYEAVEPGREGFCMRDTAHQAMGAQALGLAKYNLNMLRKFAAAVSDSKDWCSFWEIDRHNRPAPVDYKNDAEFWYNLPANFDILDACYRMYLWTGDLTYIDDPVFLNFYRRTVNDYVERWGLGLDQIMRRPRLLNLRGMLDPKKEKFQTNRGIPGYDEQDHQYVLAADLVATQYQAYLDYAQIEELRGKDDAARTFLQKAKDVRELVNDKWWNQQGQYFFGRLNKDHQLEGRGGGALLARDVVDDGPKLKSALADAGGRSPEVLYRYGDPDEAYARMVEMTTPGRSRLEYPEISYAVVGIIVNGTMGITQEAQSALLSSVEGGWVETQVRTLSGLGTKVAWAELRNLPVRDNLVTVRHEGLRKTVFTNQRGPALIWHAAFPGPHPTLLINGKPIQARIEKGTLGREDSWARVTVGAAGTVTVEVPK